MIRDYVNYKRKPKQPIFRLFLGLFLIFSACLLAFSFYAYKHSSLASMRDWLEWQSTSFISKLFHPKQSKPALPLKRQASNEQEEVQPIHFDFYDELPKSAPGFSPQPATEEAKTTEKTLAPDKREAEVMQDLAMDLSSIQAAEVSSYILQLSEFRSVEAANRYRRALAAAGLSIDLVTLREGKEVIYRLQQGPYHNLEQLKLAQKQLRKRGIACDIRKLPPYEEK